MTTTNTKDEARRIGMRCKVAGNTDGTFTFIGSTATIDRVGDTIDPAGWELSQWAKNPVVLYNHDYSALPVGRGERVWIEGGALRFIVRFAEEISGMAKMVAEMYRGGFLSAVSVGFKPLEMDRTADGYAIKRAELLELSCVPVPANAEALIAGKSAGKRMVAVGERDGEKDDEARPIVEAWVKAMVKPEPARCKDCEALESRVKALEAFIGTPTNDAPPTPMDDDAQPNNGDEPSSSDEDLIDPEEVDDSPALTEALSAWTPPVVTLGGT